jgi:hypothetical protein
VTFQRNTLPQSLRLKSKPSKKTEEGGKMSLAHSSNLRQYVPVKCWVLSQIYGITNRRMCPSEREVSYLPTAHTILITTGHINIAVVNKCTHINMFPNYVKAKFMRC